MQHMHIFRRHPELYTTGTHYIIIHCIQSKRIRWKHYQIKALKVIVNLGWLLQRIVISSTGSCRRGQELALAVPPPGKHGMGVVLLFFPLYLRPKGGITTLKVKIKQDKSDVVGRLTLCYFCLVIVAAFLLL